MVETAEQRAGFAINVPASVGTAFGLVIQIMVAAVLFVIIGGAAVLLNLATNFCDTYMLAPQWVVIGMRGLEALLWIVDVTCCVLLVLREAYDFCGTTLRGRER
jgi:hypothetical protein